MSAGSYPPEPQVIQKRTYLPSGFRMWKISRQVSGRRGVFRTAISIAMSIDDRMAGSIAWHTLSCISLITPAPAGCFLQGFFCPDHGMQNYGGEHVIMLPEPGTREKCHAAFSGGLAGSDGIPRNFWQNGEAVGRDTCPAKMAGNPGYPAPCSITQGWQSGIHAFPAGTCMTGRCTCSPVAMVVVRGETRDPPGDPLPKNPENLLPIPVPDHQSPSFAQKTPKGFYFITEIRIVRNTGYTRADRKSGYPDHPDHGNPPPRTR